MRLAGMLRSASDRHFRTTVGRVRVPDEPLRSGFFISTANDRTGRIATLSELATHRVVFGDANRDGNKLYS